MLLPRLRLRLRIRPPSARARDGWRSGVRLRRRGRGPDGRRPVWYWVVDVDSTLPALTEHLGQAEGYTVEDVHGRRVGIVVSACLVTPGRAELVLFLDSGARVVGVQDIAEIAPSSGVLVLATPPTED